MTTRQSYRAGAAFGALSFIVIVGTSLASSIAVARVYGVGAVGRWALAMAPVNAVWFLSSFRERPALLRELALLEPRAPRVTGLFAAVFAASLGLTLVVGTAGALVAAAVFRGPLHHPEVVGDMVLAMVGYVLVTNTCFNLDTIFAGFRTGRALFWIRAHQSIAFLVVAVVGGMRSPTATTLVVAGIASYATALVHRLIAIRRIMRWRVPPAAVADGLRTLPGVLRFGLKVMPGGIADGIANESGTWILAATGTITGVGAYNRAWTFARRFVELSWRLNEMLFPTLVERRAQGDHDGFDRALVDSVRYAAAVMLLPAAAAGGAAAGFMDLLGAGFGSAAAALSILLVMPALATMSNLQRHALYAIDQPLRGTASALTRLAVTIGTGVPLALRFGATGVAAAVILGYAADLAYMSGRIRGALARPLRELVSLRQALAMPLAYAVGLAASASIDAATVGAPGVAAAMLAGGAAYVTTFAIAGGVGERDRVRLSEARAAIAQRMTRRTRATPAA